METQKTIFHRDGTVSYWSVYAQQWVDHGDYITDDDLGAMNAQERRRIIKHLGDLLEISDEERRRRYWERQGYVD